MEPPEPVLGVGAVSTKVTDRRGFSLASGGLEGSDTVEILDGLLRYVSTYS